MVRVVPAMVRPVAVVARMEVVDMLPIAVTGRQAVTVVRAVTQVLEAMGVRAATEARAVMVVAVTMLGR